MRVVPTKITIAGAVLMISGGTAFTLAYLSSPSASSYQERQSSASEKKALTSDSGVVENPPVDVTVNGTAVPTTNGSTTIDTPGGVASVNVHGDSASVSVNTKQTTQSTSTPSTDMNVSVRSQTSTGGSVTSSSHSSSSTHGGTTTRSNGYSNVSVFGSGGGHVEVHTSN